MISGNDKDGETTTTKPKTTRTTRTSLGNTRSDPCTFIQRLLCLNMDPEYLDAVKGIWY